MQGTDSLFSLNAKVTFTCLARWLDKVKVLSDEQFLYLFYLIVEKRNFVAVFLFGAGLKGHKWYCRIAFADYATN